MSNLIKNRPEIINLEYLRSIELNKNKQLQNILTSYTNYLKSSSSFFAIYDNEKVLIKSTLLIKNCENENLPLELSPIFSENKKDFISKSLHTNSGKNLQNFWTLETLPSYYLAISLTNESEHNYGFLGFLFNESFLIKETQKTFLKTLNAILIEYLNIYCRGRTEKNELKIRNEKLVHDLRNPLTIVSLHAELIKEEENISDDTQEACEKIGEAIKKMSKIAFEFIKE